MGGMGPECIKSVASSNAPPSKSHRWPAISSDVVSSSVLMSMMRFLKLSYQYIWVYGDQYGIRLGCMGLHKS